MKLKYTHFSLLVFALVLFLFPVIIIAKEKEPFWNQTDFLFRDDDGSEILASGYGPSDTEKNINIADIAPGAVFRLRFGIEVADADGTIIPHFEFKQGTDCTVGSWTAITSTSDIFSLYLSDNFSDGDVTTKQITNGSFVAGKILELTNPASSLDLSKNKNTEYEWSVKVAENIPFSTTYSFRISNNGSTFDDYEICPALTTQPPLPTVTISAEPTTITLGQSSTLTWSSTNAISCDASGEWSGSKLLNGIESVTPDSLGTKDYTLTCSGSGGSAFNTTTITVNEPPPPPPPPPIPSADLLIEKLESPDPVIAGNTLTYIITVTNNGPDDAENVIVSDTLPLAFTSPSIISSQGACTVFPCNLGVIANNHSASITIISPVDPSTTGTITNIASVLSDTDDPVISNNTSAQDTTVSSSSSPVPSRRGTIGTKPTAVIFSGKTFPNAKIFVVDKDVRFETTVNQSITADENGAFEASFISISQGLHSFGLLIKDKDNRATQTKFFNIDIIASNLVVKDILVPPTIGLLARLVSRGQPVIIIGNASPGNDIILEIDDIIKKETSAEKDGSYKIAIDTGTLEFGTHHIRVKQIDINQKQESDYSPTNIFVVSHLVLPKTDLSGDGIVNIKDWSIFLSSWGSKDENQRKIIDLNGDGEIDISDFSMFIRTIKK